ncbi:CRP/FNR family transcriptional regulator [Salirhabdus euzebyi]|uniref:CRP/FNR family transcriptional regulator n=1 Tax=Salirhabdus euzebyi TaxID=394506 RepID=A0A841Q3R5_9BACI|nr:Crp/Fnr family transcriptional regulator [Salirhabdus euzebyi]MBB6453027.1 CRP/FNR family transcriptional regulator [Salirhabdus euzebyi]
MDRAQIKEWLSRQPLFQGLTDQEMDSVVDLAGTRHYKTGMHVFMQGEPVTNVYFIHDGRVKIYKTDINGKEQIVNVLQPGHMFPHQGFFRKGNYPAHAEVTEAAKITYIPIHSFENFLLQNPEISIKLFRVLGDIIVDLQGRLEEKLLHTTYNQVILLLIRLAKIHGEKLDKDWVQFNTTFTNRELANMIGSTRETVNRTIAKLKKKKIIKISSSQYLIVNPSLLEEEIS